MLILDLIVSYLVPAAVVVLAILVLAASVRVANQYERGVVFRLGKFNRTAGPGLYLVWPIIEWQIKLDLRTVTRDVEQQEGITRCKQAFLRFFWPSGDLQTTALTIALALPSPSALS
jgi:regulator of protease activity HflC (stomatin/prohibitin superfamily)